MKLHYYPETDSLYIELSEEPGVETREVSDGVNVDIDARGKLVASTSIAPRTSWICPHWKQPPCRFAPTGSGDGLMSQTRSLYVIRLDEAVRRKGFAVWQR